MGCGCRSFPGDDIPIVRGSALAALQGKDDAIGRYVPRSPVRHREKTFLDML